jgi:microcystin-dependent protein
VSEPFIGEIRIWAGNFAPRGWAFCNGQLMPIQTNTALFALVGTIYGGDGETTFALPNLEGRAPMHWGRGPGLTSRRIGQRGGEETISLTEQQMPAHTHVLNAIADSASDTSPKNNALGSGEKVYGGSGTTVPMSDNALSNSGGSQAHDNRPPYLGMYFCIALTGAFPS